MDWFISFLTGGCHGKPRPCVPPCDILHSECGHSGECLCEIGYRPIYREGSALDGPRNLAECELINHTNSSHLTDRMNGENDIRVVYFPSKYACFRFSFRLFLNFV